MRARPARATIRASRRRGRRARTSGDDPDTAAHRPGAGGAALATAFGSPRATAWRRTASGPSPRPRPRSRRPLASPRPSACTDAFMKVICIAPSGRSGYAAHTDRSVSGHRRARARRATPPRKAAFPGEPVQLPPGRVPGRARAARRRRAAVDARLLRVQRPRLRRGPQRAERAARPARGGRGREPRRLAALRPHLQRALRRRGRAQGAAAADPGRRGPPRGARHRAARRWPAPSPPATRSRPGGSPFGPACPPTWC